MEIKGRVHCLFEQSGTFKNEFRKLGIQAFDYDVQNKFGETNIQIDIFKQIQNWWEKKITTIFDTMTGDDLVMAFFPCIYFECQQQLIYTLRSFPFQNEPKTKQIDIAIERLNNRTKYHILLYKLLYICYEKKLRLIIENPANSTSYLVHGQNFPPPTFIDRNRTKRGDMFKKPTAYWFFNCTPTFGNSYQKPQIIKKISNCKKSTEKGQCSIERSFITPEYARNFICDFILGREQPINKQLFLNL